MHRAAGVALTFDGGPDPCGTPAVLAALAGAGVRATFFLAGEHVERYPAVAAEVAARGHEIGVHCHRHRVQLALTERGLRGDLEPALVAIGDATAVRPRLHRPPFGIYSAAGLRVARSAALTALLWSRWGKDWRRWTTSERIARRATAGIRPGDVILLHDADHSSARDSWRRSVAARSHRSSRRSCAPGCAPVSPPGRCRRRLP